jgi:hypothetical protein
LALLSQNRDADEVCVCRFVQAHGAPPIAAGQAQHRSFTAALRPSCPTDPPEISLRGRQYHRKP